MSNKPGTDAQQPKIDPKPAETFIQPEPDELSEGDLEKAAGGLVRQTGLPTGGCATTIAHDG